MDNKGVFEDLKEFCLFSSLLDYIGSSPVISLFYFHNHFVFFFFVPITSQEPGKAMTSPKASVNLSQPHGAQCSTKWATGISCLSEATNNKV